MSNPSTDISNFKSKFHQCLAAGIATMGVFSLGTVLAWTSPALPNMKLAGDFENISTTEESWIGATATLGALTGCLIAGLTTDMFGRQRTMQFFWIPFTIAWILVGYASNVPLLCCGRFLSGLCGGVFSLTAPIFISETSESHIRGTLTSAFQLMLVSGILFTYILGAYVDWSMLAFISGIIPILTGILLLFIYETPRYLLSKGFESDATKSLCWYRGAKFSSYVQTELAEVQQSIDESKKYKAKLKNLLRPEILKPLAVSLSLMVFEQISGFNVVIFYSNDIFEAAKVNIDSNLACVLIAVVQVVATIVSTILVDKSGRRVLLIFSQIVMAVSFLALGGFFFMKRMNNGENYVGWWLPLGSLTIFIIAFSIGIGPLSWTIMGEILPPNVKGLCSAIAVSLVWFSAFVVVYIYPPIVHALGFDWAFWLFALFSAIGTVVIYMFVPETKGKSLDEIQLLFSRTLVTRSSCPLNEI